jgi:aconitate hydratase
MSPPLVVAFAIAGRVDIDMTKEALGRGHDGSPVYLKDIWPSAGEVEHALLSSSTRRPTPPLRGTSPRRNRSGATSRPATGRSYAWDPSSTYIQEPPFFCDFSLTPAASHGRARARGRSRSSATP